MSRSKPIKTNAMRLLDSAKAAYRVSSYPISDEQNDGLSVAQKLAVPPDVVYKTLVLQSDQTYFVALIAADRELDLKQAAKSFGVKRLELIPVKQLLPLTGYLKGGCSPLGMKKAFPSLIDQPARDKAEIYVSAGKIGWQIVINPQTLADVLSAGFAPLSIKE